MHGPTITTANYHIFQRWEVGFYWFGRCYLDHIYQSVTKTKSQKHLGRIEFVNTLRKYTSN